MGQITSKYPSIPDPVKTIDSMYNCLQQVKQVLTLLIINTQPPTGNDLTNASQIFATLNQHGQLVQSVVIQSADLTALQAQVNALEAELALPLSTFLVPSPNQILTHLNTAGNHLVQSGICVFKGFSVNTGQASAKMTVYDGTSSSGTLLGVFDCDTVDEGSRELLWSLTNGLFVVIVGTPDLTIVVQ